MNFNAPLWRPVRILLFPFSLIYGLAVWIRNLLFDKNVFTSASFNLPVIGIGNLSAGGTGKSPLVEFLVRKLRDHFQVAILSRGYKRKTTGYALANEGSTALDIGDEPMQFFHKFPDIAIAVGEERIEAIPQLLHDRPDTQVILLDDSFQHRYVAPGMNVLLTEYANLFTRDWFLPTGDLRDLKSSYTRANVIVVTKCPRRLSIEERDQITSEIAPLPHQKIFFAGITYSYPYHILHGTERSIDENTEVLLVSGIANPAPLKKYLGRRTAAYDELLYGDHHIFTIDDWKEINKRFAALQSENKMIITTEKDATRLLKFSQSLADLPFYVLPIRLEFLFGDETRFSNIIATFINSFTHQNNQVHA